MKFSQIAHNIKHRNIPNDEFFTPPKLALKCIKMVNLKINDVVLDPCIGKRAFYDNYPVTVISKTCEDFFNYNKKVDWIITNPPYSKLDKWLRHSFFIARKGFAYLLGLHNLTARRIEYINGQGFGLSKMMIFKVFKWWGMSCFVIFEKEKGNIIEYDRTVWR